LEQPEDEFHDKKTDGGMLPAIRKDKAVLIAFIP
jgi:hypothetical protein